MLSKVTTALDSSGTARRVEIAGDVLDVARRAVEGDATLGWDGDDTLQIEAVYGPEGARFEVTAADRQGRRYLVFIHPRCDASLIRRLAAADNRRRDPVAEAMAQQAARERSARADRQARNEDMADRLHWALKRDIGHLYGGTRRQHAIGGKR